MNRDWCNYTKKCTRQQEEEHRDARAAGEGLDPSPDAASARAGYTRKPERGRAQLAARAPRGPRRPGQTKAHGQLIYVLSKK